MNLFGIFQQNEFTSGVLCNDCGALIDTKPEGKPRLCDECQEVDRKFDEVMGNDLDAKTCHECAGNGTTNPPRWTVKCRRCNGRGVLKEEPEFYKMKRN